VTAIVSVLLFFSPDPFFALASQTTEICIPTEP